MKKEKMSCFLLTLCLLLTGCGGAANASGDASADSAETGMEYCCDSGVIQWEGQVLSPISHNPESSTTLCTDDSGNYIAAVLDSEGTVQQSTVLQPPEGMELTALANSGTVAAAYTLVSSDESGLVSQLSVDSYSEDGTLEAHLFSLENLGCPLFLCAYQGGYLLGINQEPTLENCRQADHLYWWKDGTLTECQTDLDVVYSALTDEDGILLSGGIRIQDLTGQEPTWDYGIYRLDPIQQKEEHLMTPSGRADLISVEQNRIYALVKGGVSLLNPEDGTEERIAGLTELGVTLNGMLLGGWCNDETFYLQTSSGTTLRLYKTEVPTLRKTVTLGYVNELSIPEAAIAAFNGSSSQYRIQLVPYGDSGSLGVALSSSDGPDLIDTTFVPMASYQNKGVFLDVSSLIGETDYLPGLQSLISSQGEIYSVPLRFSLWGMMVRDDYLAEHPSITLSDLQQLPAEELALSDPLSTLLDATPNLFSSDNAGETLVSILNIAKTQQQTDTVAQLPAVLMPFGIYDPTTASGMAQFRQGYSITGWPGLGTDGLAAYPMGELAINSAGNQLDGAQAVLRYFLSQEGQAAMSDSGISVTQQGLRSQVQSAVDSGLSQEEADQFEARVATVGALVRRDDTILQITREEAQACFSGDKTAEDVAALIQNRVGIYLAE